MTALILAAFLGTQDAYAHTNSGHRHNARPQNHHRQYRPVAKANHQWVWVSGHWKRIGQRTAWVWGHWDLRATTPAHRHHRHCRH